MGQDKLKNVSGLLLDLDGVLHVGEQLIDGAVETLAHLKSNNIPFRVASNTTTLSLDSMHAKIRRFGLPVEREEIFGVIQAAVAFLRRKEHCSCKLLLAEDAARDFGEFTISNDKPDFIVVGDIGNRWNYDIINEIFGLIINGAELIALQRGKFWQTEAGLQVDIGVFIAGLEYVTDKPATVIGKPSEPFFRLAAESMGLTPDQVLMVGDDIDSDIGGAQRAGIRGVLVRTGKYREELADKSDVTPDLVLDSIRDLVDIL